MRLLFPLLLLLTFQYKCLSQIKSDTLTNPKIINMVKNGINDILIKKIISTSKHVNFDLSSDGLILLKKNNVSDSVIVAMFDKGVPTEQIVNNETKPVVNKNSVNQKNTNNTTSEVSQILNELQPGIYYFSKNGDKSEYVRLNASSSATGMKQELFGMGHKREFIINGGKALVNINVSNPIFYMKLGKGYDDILYQPTQFVVIRALPSKGNRVIAGKSGIGVGAIKNMFLLDKKYVVEPNYQRINENLFKVTFEKNLPNGNYFFGPPNSSGSNLNQKMDFLDFDIIIK